MSVKVSDSFFVAVSMSSYEVDVNSYIRGPGKVLVITRSHQLVYTHINTATVFSGTLKPFQNKSMKAVTQMRKKMTNEQETGSKMDVDPEVGGKTLSIVREKGVLAFYFCISFFCEHMVLNRLIGYLKQAVCSI